MRKDLSWKTALDVELCLKQGIKVMEGMFEQAVVFEPCHPSNIFHRYCVSDALLGHDISEASSTEMIICCGYIQIAAHPVPV